MKRFEMSPMAFAALYALIMPLGVGLIANNIGQISNSAPIKWEIVAAISQAILSALAIFSAFLLQNRQRSIDREERWSRQRSALLAIATSGRDCWSSLSPHLTEKMYAEYLKVFQRLFRGDAEAISAIPIHELEMGLLEEWVILRRLMEGCAPEIEKVLAMPRTTPEIVVVTETLQVALNSFHRGIDACVDRLAGMSYSRQHASIFR